MTPDNGLTTKPIPGMIWKIALPVSIGFFFHTMYNVVDTFYGGLISTQALAALSLSFPVFFLIIAIGNGIGTGATALISNALGKGRPGEAKTIIAQSITFSVILSIALTFIGLAAAPGIFRLLGAEGSYLGIALEYINPIFLGTMFFLLTQAFNSVLVSNGETKPFRNVLVIGFFLNLLFDPWFMFGGYGLPAMGIAGIAWATVLITFVGMAYLGLKCFSLGRLPLDEPKLFVPRKKEFYEIAGQGFPASLNMMTVALGIFIITYFISGYGQEAVAGFGIAVRADQIALLPTIGINVAVLALVGQNNGAKKFARVKETLYTASKYSLAVSVAGAALVYLFAPQLMGLFTSDANVIGIGVGYLKISVFAYWAYALLFVTIAALQGMKKPMAAVWIGLARQIVFAAPVYWFLSEAMGMGLAGIWLGILGITSAAALVAFGYAKCVLNRCRAGTGL